MFCLGLRCGLRELSIERAVAAAVSLSNTVYTEHRIIQLTAALFAAFGHYRATSSEEHCLFRKLVQAVS